MNRMAVQKRIKDIEDSLQKASIVLVDIEGTTTSISYVKDKLFPYIRSNLESYVKAHWNDADFQEVMLLLREQAKQDEADKVDGVVLIPDSDEENTKEAVVKNVFWQMDLDRKTKALKQLQGHIAREGYRNGNLKGHVYPDVVPALKSWTHNGRQVYIYSSGSVEAQKLLFGHSEEGDLLDLFSGHFDTEIGPKVESSSYLNIVKKLECKSEDVVFLTDVPREAKAAQEAGVNAVLVVREGNEPLAEEDQVNFPVIKSFHDFVFEVSAKRKKMSTDESSSLADLTTNGPINEKDISSILSSDKTKTEMVEKPEISSSGNEKSFSEDVEMMDISNNDAQEINTKTDNSVSVDESETANNMKMSVEESEVVQVDSKESVPEEVTAKKTDDMKVTGTETELKPSDSGDKKISEVNDIELKQEPEKQVEAAKTDMNVKVEVDDSRSTETENGKSDIDSTTVEVGSSREDIEDKDDVEVVSTEEDKLAVIDKNIDVARETNVESQISDADSRKEKVDSIEAKTDSVETKTNSKKSEIDSQKIKTESVQATTDSVETKIGFVQAPTKSAQATTDSVETKTDSIQATTDSAEGKTDSVGKNKVSAEAITDSIETKTDSIQATTDLIELKMDSVDAKTDSIETKTSSVETKTDSIEIKTNFVEAKAESIETKTDSVQATIHSIETKAVSIETETDPLETKNLSIETKADSIQAKTDGVESKTDTLESKTESSESKTESLELKTEAVLKKTDFSEEKSGDLEENMGSVEMSDSVEGKDEPVNTSVVKQAESVEQKHNFREEKTDSEEVNSGAIEAELHSSGVKADLEIDLVKVNSHTVEAKEADSQIDLVKVNSDSVEAKEHLVMTKANLAEVQVDETRTSVANTSMSAAEISDAVETKTSIEEPKAGSGDQTVCLGDSKTDLEDAKDGSGDAKINIEEINTEEVLRVSEKGVNIEINKPDEMEETADKEFSVSGMECDVASTKETEKMEMDSTEVEVEGGIRTGSVEVVESMDTEPITKDEQMDIQTTMNVDLAGRVIEQMDTESTEKVDVINKVTEQMDMEVSMKVEIETKAKEQMDIEPITKHEIDDKVAESISKETSAQPETDSVKTTETMEVENESENVKVEEGSTNLTNPLVSKESVSIQLETEINNVEKDNEVVTDQAESDLSGETTTTEMEPSSSTATLQTVQDTSPKEDSNVEKICKESESSNEENKAKETVSESVENSATGVVRGDVESEKSQEVKNEVRGNESKNLEAENGLTSTAQNGKGEDVSNNGPESEQNGVLDEQDVKVKKLPLDGSDNADKTEDDDAAVAAASS